jgi:hypothetical protein
MKNSLIIFSILLLCLHAPGFTQEDGKKIEVEVSVGTANGDPEPIFQRAAGVDGVISQYAHYYQLDYSASGGTQEKKMFIPFNVSVNYRLNRRLYLKAGVDYVVYSQNNSVLEKSFQVDWADFYEAYDYQFSDKISYLMPQVGVGFRHASFDFYGALGMGFARLTHKEELAYSESQPAYNFNTLTTYSANGSAPGAVIGIKYRLPLYKKSAGKGLNAILKLEAVILKIKKFTGTRSFSGSDSEGNRMSDSADGTLYQLQWDPYGNQWIDFWELYDTVPSDASRRNFQELGINFSGIRLMIGFSI